MHIEITKRQRPFCHLPGTYVVLPGSSLRLQVFPAMLIIDDLSGALPEPRAAISFEMAGPFSEFTVCQDLEKGDVQVWGKSRTGHLRYRIAALAAGEGVMLTLEKKLPAPVALQCAGEWKLSAGSLLNPGDRCAICPDLSQADSLKCFSMPMIDRLSLGSHKAQDVELMRRRMDFAEIFPHWHRLGQVVKHRAAATQMGTAALLATCQLSIQANAPEHILSNFKDLFLTGFEGILSPRLIDTSFQGIALPKLDPQINASPLQLLLQGAELIRSLFIQQEQQHINLLPALPPEFHCGRLLNTACGQEGLLSLEWTKKSMRRACFHAFRKTSISFSFSTSEKRCRLRRSNKDFWPALP